MSVSGQEKYERRKVNYPLDRSGERNNFAGNLTGGSQTLKQSIRIGMDSFPS
jgi:hypothetical protein